MHFCSFHIYFEQHKSADTKSDSNPNPHKNREVVLYEHNSDSDKEDLLLFVWGLLHCIPATSWCWWCCMCPLLATLQISLGEDIVPYPSWWSSGLTCGCWAMTAWGTTRNHQANGGVEWANHLYGPPFVLKNNIKLSISNTLELCEVPIYIVVVVPPSSLRKSQGSDPSLRCTTLKNDKPCRAPKLRSLVIYRPCRLPKSESEAGNSWNWPLHATLTSYPIWINLGNRCSIMFQRIPSKNSCGARSLMKSLWFDTARTVSLRRLAGTLQFMFSYPILVYRCFQDLGKNTSCVI